jgi:predicted nucleotidyltransferase
MGAGEKDATSALFGRSRRAVLGLFFTRPDEQFHLREVARLTGAGMGAVQRELASLVAAGLLTRTSRPGRRVEFAADPASPVFSEIRSLVVKTVGLVDVLRAALAPVAKRVRVALLFGSFARRSQHRGSDVDLLVISDAIRFDDLVARLQPVERQLARDVNPILYRTAEFRSKVAAGNPFLRRVLGGERIFVIGSDDELAALGEHRVAAPARARRGGRAGAPSRGRP